MTTCYNVDFGTLVVEAESKEDARQKALRMVSEGWLEIDTIEEEEA